MSSCAYNQELISRMVDDELNSREKAELEAHIRSCPECAALYSAFSALSRQIGGDLEESPFDLRENVMSEIRRQEIYKKNRLPRILRTVMAAAACVAVIVGVSLGVSPKLRERFAASAFGGLPAASADLAEAKSAAGSLFEEDAVSFDTARENGMERFSLPASPEGVNPMSPAMSPESAKDASPDSESDSLDAAYADAAVEEAAEDQAREEVGIQELDLSSWMDLALLHAVLGGEPAEDCREDPWLRQVYLLTVRDGAESRLVPVYVLDETLYYLDPATDTLLRAQLSPEEFADFLR